MIELPEILSLGLAFLNSLQMISNTERVLGNRQSRNDRKRNLKLSPPRVPTLSTPYAPLNQRSQCLTAVITRKTKNILKTLKKTLFYSRNDLNKAIVDARGCSKLCCDLK